ncbi:hypothetical protein [Rouxiella chamberiensis]|uniref:Uncharacterized protein n=1 Tax=Rouxiella chamberiensis TaxID=1513468 RepID=A0ABY7HQQ1_9GAMM|nr:hypothetical protein [Rouxiella chamberiensis]WAT01724.1 hypothetical protein O1V66_03015 [Rouxiella chamberiensis]
MLKKSLISIAILLSMPLAASAAQIYSCSVTHSTESESGVVQSERITASSPLTDNGDTFTINPAGLGEKPALRLKRLKRQTVDKS